jgi:hypothetical protein
MGEENTNTDTVFSYVEGEPYLLDRGLKMVNVGSGYVAANKYHSPENDPRGSIISEIIGLPDPPYRYGDGETWLYGAVKNRPGVDNPIDLAMLVTLQGSRGGVPESQTREPARGWSEIADHLGAVEIYLKQASQAGLPPEGGASDGVVKVWIYTVDDATKTYKKTLVLQQSNVCFRSDPAFEEHTFNRVMFDGNKRARNPDGTGDYYYICGEGMECGWWIDDLIITKGRSGATSSTVTIGDIYFGEMLWGTYSGLRKNYLRTK